MKVTHKFINQINPGEQVDDIYVVKDPVLRSTTRGDPYIAMRLCDKTGQVNARMWQAGESVYRMLPKPGFIRIQGKSELYQNNLQIVVNEVAAVEPEGIDLEIFLARTTGDVPAMFAELGGIVGKITHPQLKAVTEAFLGDDALMEKFRTAPAAMTIHHNYLGGLLEHTLNILKAAEAVMPLYPRVQADLVRAAIFLHDIGKTEELSYGMAFQYTDRGQLVGHIVQSVLMMEAKVRKLAEDGKPVDGDILNALEHVILSHHGEYEFGSPRIPATPEAFLVYYLDDLDAKLNQVAAAIDSRTAGDDWTEYNRNLQTRLYGRRMEEAGGGSQ
jgi:3'-5' exoribonuclease